MKIIFTALIIIGSLIQSTDSFVTNPNSNPAARSTTRSNTVSPRWASTLDKKDVEEVEEVATTSTSKKMNDNNNNNNSDHSSDNDSNMDGTSFGERITNSGVASAAAMATVSSSPVNSIIKMNE
jgi:hypothetical protein